MPFCHVDLREGKLSELFTEANIYLGRKTCLKSQPKCVFCLQLRRRNGLNPSIIVRCAFIIAL